MPHPRDGKVVKCSTNARGGHGRAWNWRSYYKVCQTLICLFSSFSWTLSCFLTLDLSKTNFYTYFSSLISASAKHHISTKFTVQRLQPKTFQPITAWLWNKKILICRCSNSANVSHCNFDWQLSHKFVWLERRDKRSTTFWTVQQQKLISNSEAKQLNKITAI